MSIQQGVLEKFPFGHLLFVLSSGISFFLLSPYEMFSSTFFNSIQDPTNFASVFEFFAKDLSAFGNISYLNTENAVVITKIIVAIIIIGIFFLLTRGIFSYLNGIPRGVWNQITHNTIELSDSSNKAWQ